jgi:hypothetical protein
VELDDYLRVEVDDCHSKKADRKLRHIQATNAAGIQAYFRPIARRNLNEALISPCSVSEHI